MAGCSTSSASRGWKIGSGGLFATVEFRDRGETNRAGPDPRDQIVAGDAGNNSVRSRTSTGATRTRRDLMTFANAEIPVTAADADPSTRSAASAAAPARTAASSAARCRTPTGRRSTRTDFFRSSSRTSSTFGDRRRARHARGWFWDASAQYGYNSFDFNVTQQPERLARADDPAEPDASSTPGSLVVRSVPDQRRRLAPGRCRPGRVR